CGARIFTGDDDCIICIFSINIAMISRGYCDIIIGVAGIKSAVITSYHSNRFGSFAKIDITIYTSGD
ncbi:hypothetical protein DJ537_25710, partial [Enterobacter hormaechei]